MRFPPRSVFIPYSRGPSGGRADGCCCVCTECRRFGQAARQAEGHTGAAACTRARLCVSQYVRGGGGMSGHACRVQHGVVMPLQEEAQVAITRAAAAEAALTEARGALKVKVEALECAVAASDKAMVGFWKSKGVCVEQPMGHS